MNHLSDNDWVIISAGKTVTAEHNGKPQLEAVFTTSVESSSLTVSAVYDFSATGPGTFTFDPVPGFQVMGPDNAIKLNIANTRSVSITVADDVSKRELSPGKRELSLGKRDSVECSDPVKKQFISDSIDDAKYLKTIVDFWVGFFGSGDDLFMKYFGSNLAADIRAKWDVIGGDGPAPTILECEDRGNYCGSSTAFYLSDNNSRIHFCDYFFKYKESKSLCEGSRVAEKGLRGGAVIHALALAHGVADEVIFGCQESQQLTSAYKPKNADNYEVSTRTPRCPLEPVC